MFMILGIAFFCVTVYLLRKKGRTSAVWALYAVFLTPIAFIHALVMDDATKVSCPYCKEPIDPTALVCPHCQRDLSKKSEPCKTYKQPMAEPVDAPTSTLNIKHDVDLNDIPENFNTENKQ